MATDLTPDELRISAAPSPPPEEAAGRVGFWAALAAVALTVTFVVLTIAFPGEEWAGIEVYAGGFRTIQVAQLIPVLLLCPVVVILMGCVHVLTPAHRRLFSHVAVIFAGIYAAIIATNYVMQLVVVRQNVAADELVGLSLLAMPNPRSLFVALEVAGYGFFALMALAGSAAFPGTGRGRWIAWLLLTTGVTGLVGAAAGLADQRILMLTGFGLSLAAFLVAALLLAVQFRHLPSGHHHPVEPRLQEAR
jgi:hypothetical protein